MRLRSDRPISRAALAAATGESLCKPSPVRILINVKPQEPGADVVAANRNKALDLMADTGG